MIIILKTLIIKNILLKYIPEKAVLLVEYLINEHKINLKIVNQRQSKHGDFRTFSNGETQITVNNNLNKHQFLLTLIHEIAHHITHKKFGQVQPHGKEWKTIFQHLMLPFFVSCYLSEENTSLLG
ncbi:SprT-like domain-containing protein [Tenacibaculum finnmarkense]|uniref:SprT-like domain-containing protein n=1 Tax=Tenacibaculum finnmarkense TaxID=2781243 RepID=UPI00374DECEC